MDIYARGVLAIIKAQQDVIGPIAIDQARQVNGLKLIDEAHVSINGKFQDVISRLVAKYEYFFGQASVEVCKDALRELKPPIPSDMLPENLRYI